MRSLGPPVKIGRGPNIRRGRSWGGADSAMKASGANQAGGAIKAGEASGALGQAKAEGCALGVGGGTDEASRAGRDEEWQ
eukprot:10665568-Alexandrium_andersonii.AAC.1